MDTEQPEGSVQSSTHDASVSSGKGVHKDRYWSRHRKLLLGIIGFVGLFIVLVIGFSVWWLAKNSIVYNPERRQFGVCSASTLLEAKNAMDTDDSEKARDVVFGIMSRTDYVTDLNCLYILNEYNMTVDSPSEFTIQAFAESYNAQTGLDPVLKASTATVEERQRAWDKALDDQKEKLKEPDVNCNAIGCLVKENGEPTGEAP